MLDSGTLSSIVSGSASTSVTNERPGVTHSPTVTNFADTTPSNGARTTPSLTPFAITDARALAALTCEPADSQRVAVRSASDFVIAPCAKRRSARWHSISAFFFSAFADATFAAASADCIAAPRTSSRTTGSPFFTCWPRLT
jgi:hypothetical protein